MKREAAARVIEDGDSEEREISEAEFMKFWMGKLDFSQNSFKRLRLGQSLQLETIMKIA